MKENKRDLTKYIKDDIDRSMDRLADALVIKIRELQQEKHQSHRRYKWKEQ
jgi:hypothetical protein